MSLRSKRILELIVLAVSFTFASVSATRAETIYVDVCGNDSWTGLSPNCIAPDGPKKTLVAGVNAASEGDTVIVANGTYSGIGNNNIVIVLENITVKSANGPDDCTINLIGSTLPAFAIIGNGITSATVIEGFTIKNGDGFQSGTITISTASPTIRGNIFLNNLAIRGGAIHITQSNAILEDNVFNCNFAIEDGGALYIEGSDNVQLNGNVFLNNSSFGSGGGICISASTVNICGGTFNGNGSDFGAGVAATNNSTVNINGTSLVSNIGNIFGGAVISDNSDTTITLSEFLFNLAGAGGGACATSSGSSIYAILCRFAHNTTGTPKENGSGDGGAMFNLGVPATIIDCIFEDNSAGRGGAIYNSQTNLQSTNCLFSGNTASSFGGAIYNLNSHPQLKLATMWGNSAASGGGLYNTTSSFPNISNSILSNNAPNQIVNVGGSSTTVTYSNIQGGWAGTGNINANPMFVDPVNGDFNLSPGSPCIDAGNNAAVPFGTDNDLAGNLRFVDDPKTVDTGQGKPPLVDMGPLEFQVISTCPWDIDGSGTVGTVDLLTLLGQWGTAGSADFDGNGMVGTSDLLALLANWGPCP